MMASIFAKEHTKVYSYRFHTELVIDELRGGVPLDPRKGESWIRAKMGEQPEQVVAKVIREHLADLDEGADVEAAADAALSAAVDLRQLNGFKKTESGEYYIEGRQVKAMIKENANIQWPKRRWGPSNKGTRAYFAEHVFVPEKRIGLGVSEPSGVHQSFIHTWRGDSIQYEEFVLEAKVSFTLITDIDISRADWSALWVSAEQNGLGASRSAGAGTFEVRAFDKLK